MTVPPITHHPVTSSNVESAGYDPDSQTFAVKFNSGSTYHYHGVTPEQHQDFQSAESKGSWVHHNLVKTKHDFTKH